eukprot:1114782-Pleurochrysis_carterae.AAC.1
MACQVSSSALRVGGKAKLACCMSYAFQRARLDACLEMHVGGRGLRTLGCGVFRLRTFLAVEARQTSLPLRVLRLGCITIGLTMAEGIADACLPRKPRF